MNSNKTPRASIIITNYNGQDLLKKYLPSIIREVDTSLGHEIIVVDDGSYDKSREIIKHYLVTLVEQPNQGVATARNTGIARSTGDYFISIDADDELEPDYIGKTLKLMQGDVQVVYTDLQFIGNQQGVVNMP